MLDALVVGLALPTIAIATSLGSDDYAGSKDRAAAIYQGGLEKCDSPAESAKDSCVAGVKTRAGR